jgi:hypothetical protein
MKAAWLNADLAAIETLFAKTTEYYETPFDKPATNISEILKLWKDVKNQKIKRLDFTILAIDENSVVVQWILEYSETKFDGIYLIKFNNNKECIFFKSWEMKS